MSSSTSRDTSDEEFEPSRPVREHRTAKKSTAAQVFPENRRQLRNKSRIANMDNFIANFNPETSTREKRKLHRKINPPTNARRPNGAIYDENGVHVASGMDLCDCLNEDCFGCFFECPKCGSQKCGPDCRVHRKFIIDQIEYHGYDNVIKNPLLNKN